MAVGFAAMRQLEDLGLSKQKAFEEAFKEKWKHSTFNDQERAWNAAGLQAGEQARWYAFGRTREGEWKSFMKEWRQS